MLHATLINLQSFFSCQALIAKFYRNWTLNRLGKMVSLNIVKHCLNVLIDGWGGSGFVECQVVAFSHKKLDLLKILDPQLLESPTDMLDQQNMKWCKPSDCKKACKKNLSHQITPEISCECDCMSYWRNFFTPCREYKFLHVSIYWKSLLFSICALFDMMIYWYEKRLTLRQLLEL